MHEYRSRKCPQIPEGGRPGPLSAGQPQAGTAQTSLLASQLQSLQDLCCRAVVLYTGGALAAPGLEGPPQVHLHGQRPEYQDDTWPLLIPHHQLHSLMMFLCKELGPLGFLCAGQQQAEATGQQELQGVLPEDAAAGDQEGTGSEERSRSLLCPVGQQLVPERQNWGGRVPGSPSHVTPVPSQLDALGRIASPSSWSSGPGGSPAGGCARRSPPAWSWLNALGVPCPVCHGWTRSAFPAPPGGGWTRSSLLFPPAAVGCTPRSPPSLPVVGLPRRSAVCLFARARTHAGTLAPTPLPLASGRGGLRAAGQDRPSGARGACGTEERRTLRRRHEPPAV